MTKIALITGASRGLGAALAEELAATHHVIAVARTVGGLEALDDRIQAKGLSATLAPMDITVPEAMQQLAASIGQRWGKLDLWCHTAVNAPHQAPADHIDPKETKDAIPVNLEAVTRLIPLFSPLLKAAPAGHAVFFQDSTQPAHFFGLYGSSKAGQIALARSWQAESERLGPAVSILEPRRMNTSVRGRFYPGGTKDDVVSPMDEATRLLPMILTPGTN
ncbi:MAG: SDR family NAD(P)-dependent oxidoreductase [Pseudomonadota bacterium]